MKFNRRATSDRFDATRNYAAGTIGAALVAVSINVGAFPWSASSDGSDATAAIQAALDFAERAAIDPQTEGDVEVVFPPGRYAVTSLEVGVRTRLRFAGGVLVPFETVTARTHLLKIRDHTRVYQPCIDMGYALNYDTAVWVRGRFVDIIAPEIWKARCAWVFGDPAWEGDAASGHLGDSEISIVGGASSWCVTVARAYGQNTIVNFGGGHRGYSYKLAGTDPAWLALSEIGFVSCGALMCFEGCLIGNFSAAQPILQSKVQLASAAGYVNAYGQFRLTGTHLEGGIHLQAAATGAVLTENGTKLLSMVNCGGYVTAGRAGYLIDAGNAKQAVDVRACDFYGDVTDELCYAVNAKVHIDQRSYDNADVFAHTRVQRPVGHAGFQVLNANTSAQAFTGVPSRLACTTVGACDLESTVAPTVYDTGTGVFTAPTDMRGVTVEACLYLAAGASTDTTDFLLYIDNALIEGIATTGASVRATFRIPRLARGQIVDVRIAQYQSRSADGSPTNRLRISGAC